ncbi:AAEL009659-PA [Aedes aegypti]|uniref:AAEL009659-PA n=2 Tax=Aedes aegypti TaxID=7159 RepID=Q16V78_AEDAE|nr:AAEL009659-PA [Aedes aegypti]
MGAAKTLGGERASNALKEQRDFTRMPSYRENSAQTPVHRHDDLRKIFLHLPKQSSSSAFYVSLVLLHSNEPKKTTTTIRRTPSVVNAVSGFALQLFFPMSVADGIELFLFLAHIIRYYRFRINTKPGLSDTSSQHTTENIAEVQSTSFASNATHYHPSQDDITHIFLSINCRRESDSMHPIRDDNPSEDNKTVRRPFARQKDGFMSTTYLAPIRGYSIKVRRRLAEPALLGAGGGNGFAPNFSPPEFHPSENWKPTPAGTHVGLMKDPPLTRNGPANFIQPAQQQGAVMMVYGLDNSTANTDKLFNLFCLYGNVVRIKFLKTKEGTAMVQMGDAIAVERSIQHLNNIPIGNDGSKIQIAFSKQNYLSESTNPYTLPDNSISFKDYSASKNNRFLSLTQASKNRIQPPSKILHFFNTPPGMSEDQLLNAFTSKDCLPSQVRMFPLKSERSSSGLVEFPSVALAVNAIMKCNHSAIDHKGTKFPFIMKLCFSSSKTMNGAWNNENIENMNTMGMAQAQGNPMTATATVSSVAASSTGVVNIQVTGHKVDDEPM